MMTSEQSQDANTESFRTEFSRLHDHLDSILEPLFSHEYSYASTALDIFFAYRLLLMRAPEKLSVTALEESADAFPNISNILYTFMASPEFRCKFFGNCRRPEGRIVFVPEGRRRIAVDIDDMVIGRGIVNGDYESELCALLRQFIKPGFVCVDLGANVGYFTSLMAELAGGDGKVIAYEPFPRTCRLLQMTIQESGLSNVEVKQMACTDRAATQYLYSPPETESSGGVFLSSEKRPEQFPGMAVEELRTTSLDIDLAGEPRIDFIKMDIEGTEFHALNGMCERLQKDMPSMAIEINTPCLERNGSSPSQVLEFLLSFGYSICLVDDHVLDSPERIQTASYRFCSPVVNIVCRRSD